MADPLPSQINDKDLISDQRDDDDEEEPEEEEDPEEFFEEEEVDEFIEEEVYEEVEEEVEEEEDEEEKAKEVPDPVKQKRKQKEFEVFVGGLPRDATEEDLQATFKTVGEVLEVRLAKSTYSLQNKGFGFVRFATIEQAKRAASELQIATVKGKSCGVIKSNDNETLHVGNICTTWTKDNLVDKLKAFELENLEEVHLVEDPKNRGRNRGFAFLEFSTHLDAVAACSKLQRTVIFFGSDIRAEFSFSKKTIDLDEEVMAQVKSVYLDGLPATWDEDQVRERFKIFGEIESVQLARNMHTAKRNDFGFISFATRQAALDCIELVNKDGVSEGSEKVLMKATLKRPYQRRAFPAMGIRRGFISKPYGMRGPQPCGYGRSFAGKPSRPHEFVDRGFDDRPRGRGRFPSRKFGARAAFSPAAGRFGTRDRREFSRNETDIHENSQMPRGHYVRSSSVARRARGTYRNFSSNYSHHREHYSDDTYDPRFEHDEAYEYPTVSRYKRPYSELDYEAPPSSSVPRRSRSMHGLEMDAYPRNSGSGFTNHSNRFPADERASYGRGEFVSRDYGRRYFSGRGASRSYY